MTAPGFTAEASLGGRAARYGGRAGPSAADPSALTPQTRWGECSDGNPSLCYFCDDSNGCGCDWYYGSAYVVSSDCGSRR